MGGVKPKQSQLEVVEGADAFGDPAAVAASRAVAEAKLAAAAGRGTRRNAELLRRRQEHKPRKRRALRGIAGA